MAAPTGLPRVFTIAADQDFLSVLAQAVLNGFPGPTPPAPERLAGTTILVPNRRSARRLGDLIHAAARAAGAGGLLFLPRIRPIGDIDEDMVTATEPGDLPPALSDTARLFLLMRIIARWAADNAHHAIARDLGADGGQSLALAQSLADLFDQAEEDGADLSRLDEFYDADLSGHRLASLGLIDLIRRDLPAEMLKLGVMSARQRRNALIRLEAERLAANPPPGPVIAAGSTGTFASTRDLLRAIAGLPQGAVVLPGLDQGLDDESWQAVGPQHPQFALSNLVSFLGLSRADVQRLGPERGPRACLTSELMRPPETADRWRAALAGSGPVLGEAVRGMRLVTTRDRHREARTIALILRRAVNEPGRTAALITPDRDLARRVKEEMKRWHITLDDTAGEPLIRFGAAHLLALLMRLVTAGVTAADLVALMHHPLADLGLGREAFLTEARRLERAVLRPVGADDGIDGISRAVTRARLLAAGQELRSRFIRTMNEADWQALDRFWQTLAAVLQPLTAAGEDSFAGHLARLRQALAALAPGLDWTEPEHLALALILDELAAAADFFPPGPFARAARAIADRLTRALHHPRAEAHPRLSVMGLLEARLMRPDVAVLGGLNEGKWPAQPDGGPWLNRPMRDRMALGQPERAIGQTAHDLVQAMAAGEVYLSHAERIGDAPSGPSRWLLRLQAVLAAAGVEAATLRDDTLAAWAAALDQAPVMAPLARPAPQPPVHLRPRHFSVSDIETLIRDPYAVFARRVLKLEPLDPLGKPADAALRGQLFHDIIKRFNRDFPHALPADPEQALLERGEHLFRPFAHDPEVMHFWWPRFCRAARWLAEMEPDLRAGLAEIHAEIRGESRFLVAGVEHSLSARADRIDHLHNGRYRIIDYKTGSVPTGAQVETGLAPQLPLEAALLAQGAFADVRGEASSLLYVQAGGGRPPGKITDPLARSTATPAALAARHFAALVDLLSGYRAVATPYLPRYRMVREEDPSDFDHLSRFGEWRLAGTGST